MVLASPSYALRSQPLKPRSARPSWPRGADAPFLGGDLRWPNPWPGEKTPYFTEKTGHMARQGIWLSDVGLVRWRTWSVGPDGSRLGGRTGSVGPDGSRLGGRGGSVGPDGSNLAAGWVVGLDGLRVVRQPC